MFEFYNNPAEDDDEHCQEGYDPHAPQNIKKEIRRAKRRRWFLNDCRKLRKAEEALFLEEIPF